MNPGHFIEYSLNIRLELRDFNVSEEMAVPKTGELLT